MRRTTCLNLAAAIFMWTATCLVSACGSGDDEVPGPDSAIDQGGIEEGAGEPFTDGSRCTCSEGGVCVNQHGGPGEPVGLHCGSWRPDDCEEDDPCPCVVGEGECTLDPDELGVCQCDNGTV